MSKILYYAVGVGLVTLFLGYLATTIGRQTIFVHCPPLSMDCGNPISYSPLFWFPMIFIESGYIIPPWPGFNNYQQVFRWSVIYWFILANVIILILWKLTKFLSKRT